MSGSLPIAPFFTMSSNVAAAMNMPAEPRRAISADSLYWPGIALVILAGVFLRCYLISDQILLDDEWHSLDFVPGRTLSHLALHWGTGANSIPLNLYFLLLLRSYGWSEILLRLPSLLAGVLSLYILPALVRRVAGSATALLFGVLLAISPFLVYIARFARPYSVVCLLTFVSLLALYFWSTCGKPAHAVVYVLLSGLSVYFHLFAVIAVVAPLGFLLLAALIPVLRRWAWGDERTPPRTGHIVGLTGGLVAVVCVLVLPPLVLSRFPQVPTSDRANLETLAGFSTLLSGTGSSLLTGLFIVLCFYGLYLLFTTRFLLGGMAGSVLLSYFLAFLITEHYGIQIPLVLSRYAIALFPIGILLAAVGARGLIASSGKARTIVTAAVALFVCALFVSGPLPSTYDAPNNFTNHSAFQESYEKKRWDRSYRSDFLPELSVHKSGIPRFYGCLANASGVDEIIEFPMYVGNHVNLLYYYQHFHGKRVRVGYSLGFGQQSPSRGLIYGNRFIDMPLSRVRDRTKLRFDNLVDTADVEALTRGEPRYIVLHKNFFNEAFGSFAEYEPVLVTAGLYQDGVYVPVIHLDRAYRATLGAPVYEDSDLVVFVAGSNTTSARDLARNCPTIALRGL